MMNGSDKCANCGGDRGLHHYQTDQCPVGGVEAHVDRTQEWKTSTFAPVVDRIPPILMTDGNDAAFSRAGFALGPEDYDLGAPGMTKREYFAAMAMQGLSARPAHHEAHPLATLSVNFADALIAALNEEPK